MFSSISHEIQNIAQKIKRGVESSLGRSFNRFDVSEHDPVSYDPTNTTYRMKVLTDDNGHVMVETVRKEPGHDWETQVEEYEKGDATAHDAHPHPHAHIQALDHGIPNAETNINGNNDPFDPRDIIEHDVFPCDPENTSYCMEVITNDHGHIKVKTVRKDPGHEWHSYVEEYDRDDALEQDSQSRAAEQGITTTSQG